MFSSLVIFCGFLSGALVECNPDLDPSVPSGSQVFINQPVTVQCTTRGSQALAWRSDEYIGPEQQISFSINSIPGDTDTSSFGAQATFVRMANSNGEIMLQSILRISVVANFINFTVTCRNIDIGFQDSVSYQTMNSNITEAALVPVEEGSTCPNNNVTIKCIARKSQNIQWGSSANIGLSSLMPTCSSNAKPRRYNINGIEVVSTMHSSDANELVCCLTLLTPRFPSHTPLYITCLNLDFQIGVNVSFKIGECVSTTTMSDSALSMTTSSTETDLGSNPTEANAAPEAGGSETRIYVIVGGSAGALLLLIVLFMVIIIIIKFKIKAKTIPADLNSELNEHITLDIPEKKSNKL